VAEGVSADVLAERLEAIRDKVNELVDEQHRMRTRLHNLEGFAAAYLDQQRANRRGEERQYRRLEVRVQVLAVVVAFASVVSPLVVLLLNGK